MLQAGCSPLGVQGISGSAVGAEKLVQQIFMHTYRHMVFVVNEKFVAEKKLFSLFKEILLQKKCVFAALTHGWDHRDLAQLFP